MAPPSWRKIAEVVVRVDLLVMQSMVPRWQRPSHAKLPRCEHKLHKLLANSSNMSGRAVLRQNISRIHHALAYLGLFDLIHSYPFLSSLDSVPCCVRLYLGLHVFACFCHLLPISYLTWSLGRVEPSQGEVDTKPGSSNGSSWSQNNTTYANKR